jgi:hypothetical protein
LHRQTVPTTKAPFKTMIESRLRVKSRHGDAITPCPLEVVGVSGHVG